MGLLPYKLYAKIRQYIPKHGYYVNQEGLIRTIWGILEKGVFSDQEVSGLPEKEEGLACQVF